MIQKPINFECKILFKFTIDDNKNNLIRSICDQYGFMMDYDCVNEFLGSDSIYENLESRMIFILRRLKEEKITIIYYKITATLFNSKIHGDLV